MWKSINSMTEEASRPDILLNDLNRVCYVHLRLEYDHGMTMRYIVVTR